MNIYPYVYRLDHPVTKEFYIGYRSANKVPADEDLGKRYFTSSNSVRPRFHEFNYEVVAEFFDSVAAYDYEQLLIHESWGKLGLLNKNCHYGKKRLYSSDEETRKKISRPGQSNSNYGNKWTDEMKKALSEKKKGLPAWNKGIKAGPTGKPSWNKGLPFDDAYKKRMSERTKGIPKPTIKCCRISDKKEMSVNTFVRYDQKPRLISDLRRG